MGDMAEYYDDRTDDLVVAHWIREDAIENRQWQMRDGSLIDIKDMSDRHLRNAINMLIRNKDIYIEQDTWDTKSVFLEMLKEEQRKRRNKPESHTTQKAQNGKTCQQCGKKHNRKKFCSNHCKDVWHNTHNPRGYGLR